MAIPPDPHYIPAFSIEDVLLDKDTGAPLTGGLVTFYKDAQRLILKPVFQITGTSPNYTFIQLPNPMTLSAIGTFQDSLDNPVIPYFFPYDSSLNVELYYITVTSSGLVPQFTREAQPYISSTGGDGTVVPGTVTNEISNPQFAKVLFDTNAASVTYSFNGVTDSLVEIAPDWVIKVTAPAAGTVTVSQLAPLGSLNLPTNPGTLLQINSAGISSLQLRQRITGSPNLWGNGFLSAGFMAKVYGGTSKVLTLNYSQSNGTITAIPLVSATLPGSGNYAYYENSTKIDLSTSADDFPDGYIDIYFDLPLSVKLDITSVMAVATGSTSVAHIGYDQESNPRQLDHLFHYYKPGLDFKPISSYLIGWDFPLNPAQFTTAPNDSVAAAAVGAGKAYYAWDQTIIFQSVDSGVTAGRLVKDGSLQLTAAKDGQLALIQYLTGNQARAIFVMAALNGISALVEVAATVVRTMTISLWWSANASLPDIKTPNFNSLVTTLDANGHPSAVVAGWHELARLHIGESNKFINSITGQVEEFGFSQWLDNSPEAALADKFAIVIGTAPLTTGDILIFQSISLVPGSVPTPPAPQAPDEVLRECQYYFQKSFEQGTKPADSLGGGTGESQQVQVLGASTAQIGPIVRFPVPMINAPAITRFNVIAAGTEISSTSGLSWTGSATVANGKNGFYTTGTTPAGSNAGVQLALLHWTANALLGTF